MAHVGRPMTRSTAAEPDRAAIEALARELSDEQWRQVFEGHPPPRWDIAEREDELLAYLDEVWAGLSDEEVQDLVDNATPLGRAVLRRARGGAG